LLDTYHEERHRHVAQMIRFSSFLGSIVMSTNKPAAYCRDIVFHLLNQVQAIREILSEGRIKPQPRYKTGFLLFNKERKHRTIAGRMLSQPTLATAQERCILLDEVLGPGFALLRFHRNPKEAFAKLKTDFWERLGTQFVCIQPGIPRKEGYNSLDRERPHKETYESLRIGKAPLMVVQSHDTGFLADYRDLFVVVRPDRYILGVFREEKADMFVSAFQRLLNRGW